LFFFGAHDRRTNERQDALGEKMTMGMVHAAWPILEDVAEAMVVNRRTRAI
jgi:hypothetical protein